MGVLNATPDSFYDGGVYVGERVTSRVEELADAGALVIDIGGESTRPGAAGVGAREQIERIEPAVKSAIARAHRRPGLWVSVDTSDPRVAETVLGWGAHIINDVSCLADPELARVVSGANATLLLMHARGPMESMLGFSNYPDDGYADVVADTMLEWCNARDRAVAMGVAADDILFDPGIGFAKNATQSLALLRRLDEFSRLKTPVVVGPSRKSFLNLVEAREPERRLGATVAACLYAARYGAMMVRVHDVEVVRQALLAQRMFEAATVSEIGKGVGVGPLEGTCSTAS